MIRRTKNRVFDKGWPRAAPAYFPYRDHRTMAEVMEAEELAKEADLRRYNNQRKSRRK